MTEDQARLIADQVFETWDRDYRRPMAWKVRVGHLKRLITVALLTRPVVPAEELFPIPQVDLPADAMKVLRENLWQLYDGVPVKPAVVPAVPHQQKDE